MMPMRIPQAWAGVYFHGAEPAEPLYAYFRAHEVGPCLSIRPTRRNHLYLGAPGGTQSFRRIQPFLPEPMQNQLGYYTSHTSQPFSVVRTSTRSCKVVAKVSPT